MSNSEVNTGRNDGDPPKLTVNLPSAKDVDAPKRKRNAVPLPVDVLLLTVKECEFLACYRQLINPFKCWFDEIGFVYFEDADNGEKVRVALVQCSEGAVTPGGSLITVTKAVPVLRPKAVISVGTCSSLNPTKAKLGDVVVSAKLKELPTGMRNYVSRQFLKVIKYTAYGYKAPLQDPEARAIKVHCDGEFLSGPEKVCSETRRKELAQLHHQAIATEMEGGGVFTAAFEDQIEWLIVKGIADYADGDESTTERWSPFASVMAASVVQHILSDRDVFSAWPNYCSEDASSSSHRSQSPKGVSQGVGSVTQKEDASRVTHVIERIRQIYEKTEERLLPVPWCKDFSFHLNSLFTRLKIVGKEKERGNLTDEITNMTAIFRAHTEREKPRVVLIEGEPGMGKTTYCQKLAYDWATKQCKWDESFPKIEVLLLLKCRDITSHNIREAIDDQILPDDIQEEDKEIFFQFIQENQSKVLLVIDGLDEALPDNLAVCFKLVERRDLPDCYIVLSSRHEAGKQVRGYCDTLWEIVGFKEEDTRSFIRKYFRTQENLAETLITNIWPDRGLEWLFSKGEVDLRELTKNPLHTALLCILYEDFEGSLPTKRTELYIEIVLCVLRRYENKNGISSSTEDLVAKYKQQLIHLGRMAYKAYCEGQSYFEEHEFDYTASSPLIKFGFLSVQHGGSKRKPCHRFGFLHRSFQEFFSGFYLAFQISDEDLHYLISEHKTIRFSHVFMFMSGIAASFCQETTVNLVSRVASLIPDSDALSFVLMFISECTKYKENFKTKMVETVNDFFKLETFQVSFGFEFISILCEILAVNSTLTNLDLSRNSIGDEGAISLSQALTANSTLTNLDLVRDSIGDKGATSLSQALKVNSTLTNLDLDGNSIGAEGATSLYQALKVNSTLTNLVLRWNRSGVKGASFFS